MEETQTRPKPMVEVGGRPILWHIMKHYYRHGFTEFVIAVGYRGEMIKRYFREYRDLYGNLTVYLPEGRTDVNGQRGEEWTVHLVDTGDLTNTGGRIGRLQSWLDRGTFMATYGDAVCDVDVNRLLEFHRMHGRVATVTAVRPPARFGGLTFASIDSPVVTRFVEKPQLGEGWINGGFMVLEPAVFEYLQGDDRGLEADCLGRLADEGQLVAYRHDRYWQCMDTMRDRRLLEQLWSDGRPPWRTWE